MSAGLLALALLGYVQTRSNLVLSKSPWTVWYVAGSAVFSIVALVNSFGLRGSAEPALYLAGLGWLLFFSTSLFVRLVLREAGSGS